LKTIDDRFMQHGADERFYNLPLFVHKAPDLRTAPRPTAHRKTEGTDKCCVALSF
jgi:hypothetical protein